MLAQEFHLNYMRMGLAPRPPGFLRHWLRCPTWSGSSQAQLAGKGEAPLSLPFVAAGSIPGIYRRASFSHRATPMELPRERITHRHVSGGGKKSRNEISPIRCKCLFFSL